VFQDVLAIANFTSSEEAFAADALFLAYKEGNADKIRAVVQVRLRLMRYQGSMSRHASKIQYELGLWLCLDIAIKMS
jgi:hypothetical protein